MAKNTGITPGDHFECFEDAENKLDVLRQLLEEGERSGRADYSYETFIRELDQE